MRTFTLKKSTAVATGVVSLGLSALAGASVPPPAAPTIDRPVLDTFGSSFVARCDVDNFQQSQDPNYHSGNAYNPRNVTNRRDWAGPLLTAGSWRRMDIYSDPDTGKVIQRVSPNRLYPSFAYDRRDSFPNGGLDQKYPPFFPADTEAGRLTPEQRAANPGAYTANQTFVNQNLPQGTIFLTPCQEGCLTGWQKVEYVSGEVAIEEAAAENKRDLLTLGEDATPEHLTFMANRVESYSKDVYAVEQEILTLHTEGGGVLELTPKHPLLVGTGDVKVATDLAVGDELVRSDGSHDRIAAIEKSRKTVQAYNVTAKSSSQRSNVIVVEGFLVGSQRLQDEVNRIESREMLRDYLFPEETAI